MRVFISYRREDSAGQAGRLYDLLTARYSSESVFMDVARIEPGADFTEAIGNAVGSCNVMLAVIGRKWPGAEGPPGQHRIDEPNDFVRLEIASALKRRVAVISVLVNGAAKPAKEDLPQDVKELASALSVELREGRWEEDVARLLEVLEPGERAAPPSERWYKRRRPVLAFLVMAAAILLAIAGRRIHMPGTPVAPAGRVSTPTLLRPSATVATSATRAMSILPDGRVVSASDRGMVIWDPAVPASLPILANPDNDVMALLVLPGGLLACGTRSGRIDLWNTERKEIQTTLVGHSGAVVALASMDDGRLASGSWDGTIRLWNLTTGKLEKNLARHTSQVRALASLGNDRLASGSTDGTIIVWNLAGGTESLKTFNRRGDTVNALVRLSDQQVAAGSENGTIEIWNCATGNLETSLRSHSDWINALVVFRDGRIGSASDDRTISIWNPSNRYLDARLEGHSGRVNALAILSDGRLVSGSDDGTIRLWSVKK